MSWKFWSKPNDSREIYCRICNKADGKHVWKNLSDQRLIPVHNECIKNVLSKPESYSIETLSAIILISKYAKEQKIIKEKLENEAKELYKEFK